ncbi:MAG: hypothetical protein LBB20_00360 [Puniceicoccales bacterium]|nr:hypothetical protein [Puniceicoccales bacterium]
MGWMGITGSRRNYNSLSWSEKRKVLANANVGNWFTRLFLAIGDRHESNTMEPIAKKVVALTSIKLSERKVHKTMHGAEKIFQSLVNKYNQSENETEKKEIGTRIKVLLGKKGSNAQENDPLISISNDKLREDIANLLQDMAKNNDMPVEILRPMQPLHK